MNCYELLKPKVRPKRV